MLYVIAVFTSVLDQMYMYNVSNIQAIVILTSLLHYRYSEKSQKNNNDDYCSDVQIQKITYNLLSIARNDYNFHLLKSKHVRVLCHCQILQSAGRIYISIRIHYPYDVIFSLLRNYVHMWDGLVNAIGKIFMGVDPLSRLCYYSNEKRKAYCCETHDIIRLLINRTDITIMVSWPH